MLYKPKANQYCIGNPITSSKGIYKKKILIGESKLDKNTLKTMLF